MHVALNAKGSITAMGPTLAKLRPGPPPLGQNFSQVFDVRRPTGIMTAADLAGHLGKRLHMTVRGLDGVSLRGLAMPDQAGGLLINLSFGIGVIDAVRQHALTGADFADTDLTVEMLYLVEAKTAVMQELRHLNLRLQGAKVVAEQQALTDTLTGLRNRRALDAALSVLIAQGTGFGLMHLDLDYFKQVNDSLGHAAGDHVLRQVAQVLLTETRPTDTVARVGGDEFVVALPDLPDPAKLARISRRIIEKLSQPMDFEGKPCRISASIGLTVSTYYDVPRAERMQCDADDALYASKRAGRAQAQFYQPQKMVG